MHFELCCLLHGWYSCTYQTRPHTIHESLNITFAWVKVAKCGKIKILETLCYSWSLSGGGWRPWGDRLCVSHMIQSFGIHTDWHTQTKADRKQRLAMYYFCWSMSVRNSPLISFILFYGAVIPSAGCDGFVELFLRIPPTGSPCLFSRIRASAEACECGFD